MRKRAQIFVTFSEKLNFTASSLFYFSQITNKVAIKIVCYAIAMTNTQNWTTFPQKTNLGKSHQIFLIYKIIYFSQPLIELISSVFPLIFFFCANFINPVIFSFLHFTILTILNLMIVFHIFSVVF